MTLDETLARLTGLLTGVDRLGVAYSGGVDSSVLLGLAARVLGPDGRGGRPRGVAQPGRRGAGGGARGRRRARRPRWSRSPPTRATSPPTGRTARTGASTARTSCSPASPTRWSSGCGSTRWPTARTPTTRDDRTARAAGRRPSTRCCDRWPTPGLTKADVRDLARQLGLPNADKPAAPCLASRIPHFSEVDPVKLRPGRGRRGRRPRRSGFADCRVRHHGDVARVELPEADLVRVVASEVRRRLVARRARRGVPVRDRRPGRDPVRGVHPPAGGRIAWHDLDGIAELDLERASRRGYPEAVYCGGQDGRAAAGDRYRAPDGAAARCSSPGAHRSRSPSFAR